MSRKQDIGRCKRCGFQWVIGDARLAYRKRASGESGRKRRSIQCPLCQHGDIRIEKEDME